MKTLKYTIIKSRNQYDEYCNILEALLSDRDSNPDVDDEVELLTLLIEKWDKEQNSFRALDPVQLIKTLMIENQLKSKDLAEIMDVSKGMVSQILGYQKGLSKKIIRKLSAHFSVSQEAFNRPYKLKSPINKQYKDSSLMNTEKDIVKDDD